MSFIRNVTCGIVSTSEPTAHSVGKTIAILSCLLVLFTQTVNAQAQPDSKGTDFWLMFNENLSGNTLSLFITGDTATTGTVEIPGLAFSAPFSVTPGTVTTVGIPIAAEAVGGDSIENKGIHVVSVDEVTVYGLNRRSASTDAFLGLPTDILGTEYISLGYENTNIVNATQFGVVATQDGTTLTVTPAVTAGARAGGVPYNINLNQGQTYQLRSTLGAPADLSGSIITSNLPIAVFGSHQCGNIPLGNTFCDHIVEQMPPVSTWGTSFVTFPLETRLNGDTFRVLASMDNTNVSIDGAPVAVLSRGGIFETILTGPSVINADNPVLVAQYSNSTSFDGVTSDPFEVIVPPFEQFQAGYTITTPASGFSINFVNIVAPNAAVGAISVDGTLVPAGDYSPIGTSGFSGVAVPISLGSHNINGPSPFGLTTYGFANADSYGYPGGLALAEISNLTTLTLTPMSDVNPINTEHCVTASTLDQNGDPLPGVRVDFTVTGVHTESGFQFSDGNGDAEFCYTGTIVGDDTITATVGNINAEASKEWITDQQQPLMCDANGDEQVDVLDIRLIGQNRNVPVPPGDPALDIDNNGFINVNDARKCARECTFPRCATSAPL